MSVTISSNKQFSLVSAIYYLTPLKCDQKHHKWRSNRKLC